MNKPTDRDHRALRREAIVARDTTQRALEKARTALEAEAAARWTAAQAEKDAAQAKRLLVVADGGVCIVLIYWCNTNTTGRMILKACVVVPRGHLLGLGLGDLPLEQPPFPTIKTGEALGCGSDPVWAQRFAELLCYPPATPEQHRVLPCVAFLYAAQHPPHPYDAFAYKAKLKAKAAERKAEAEQKRKAKAAERKAKAAERKAKAAECAYVVHPNMVPVAGLSKEDPRLKNSRYITILFQMRRTACAPPTDGSHPLTKWQQKQARLLTKSDAEFAKYMMARRGSHKRKAAVVPANTVPAKAARGDEGSVTTPCIAVGSP